MISKNMDTFFEENPSASFSEFETEFGSIDEVVSSISETEFTQNSPHKWSLLYFRKKIYRICALFIILMSLIISTVYIKAYMDSRHSIPAYKVITIEEESPSNTAESE